MFKLSSRLDGLEESATLAITARAKELKAAGRDIIAFGAGEPDFDTPENIKEAAIRAIDQGQTRYTAVGGIVELKDAIIGKFERDNNLKYARDEILVSCGGKHSIYNLFQALLDPGDEVVVPAPFWVSYPPMVELAGGVARIIKTTAGTGFKMSTDDLASAITPRTRAVVINSPSNPTGAAYTAEELDALAAVVLERGLLAISDEIYEKLVYDGFHSGSIASVSDEMRSSTVVLNGVSKTYAMTGWRIGYAAAPANIIGAMTKIQSQSTSNPASISQWAAVEAISGAQDAVEKMRVEFEKRRDVMVEGLNTIEGVVCAKPQGAFYVFPDVSAVYGGSAAGREIKGSIDLAAYLLEEAGVAVVPGEPFGEDRCIRLSYATGMDTILAGLDRIATALAALQ